MGFINERYNAKWDQDPDVNYNWKLHHSLMSTLGENKKDGKIKRRPMVPLGQGPIRGRIGVSQKRYWFHKEKIINF